MKKLILPDYQNSIVNVACTIRKYFGLNYNHNTIEKIDKILEENQPRNVVVILFDGMGSKLLKEKLPSDSFLLKHLEECNSTSPWISFRHVEGKILKKITCPICGEEMIIGA